MRRFSTWVAMAAGVGYFACAGLAANASDVVSFSGTFGAFTWGNQPAPLNDGSFSGTATFAALPGPNGQSISSTADVNFYNSSSALVFTVGGAGSYDVLTAGPSGYTSLTISGDGNVGGGTTVDVAPLGMEFSSWSFGQTTGTIKPYGPPNYISQIEYTYFRSISPASETLSSSITNPIPSISTTYFDPILSGTASVPEPSTIGLSLIGMVGVLIYTRRKRRTATT
jgi:PEP-CTERM motif